MGINNQADSTYPTRAESSAAWETLASAIADTEEEVIAHSEAPTGKKEAGELIIIGSGIETLGFIRGDEELIRSADAVFYCVADPGTDVWIRQLRPDAYDLHVLYGDHKVRYTTYMQMTEAMLYPVRLGKKVVAIFYGHPGVFALAPHRATQIAKREGYKATMKAGVSALDCLCADLGVDPAFPGMQTHEATDMLVRARIPDVHLHVVLWQVGLIGEKGYRVQGYLNHNFRVLIEYLQQHYGSDYPLTHYIASRFPMVSPTIEEYRLDELYDPKIQLKINGISTFYLAPKKVALVDREMAERLGMVKPDQVLKVPKSPLRDMGCYGPRERMAFEDFRHFKVLPSYHWQENTAASQLIIALHDDIPFQEEFVANPQAALEKFPGLTAQERYLLASGDPIYLQVAAKGLLQRSTANENFLYEFFSSKKKIFSLAQALKRTTQKTVAPIFLRWTEQQGYAIEVSQLYRSFERLSRSWLLLWTGIYASEDQAYLITLQGGSRRHPHLGQLHINGKPVKQFQVGAYGTIQWAKQAGISHSGFLRFDLKKNGQRRLVCLIKEGEEGTAIPPHFFAGEMRPKLNTKSLQVKRENPGWYVGDYMVRTCGDDSDKPLRKISVDQGTVTLNQLCIKTQNTGNWIHWEKAPGEYEFGQLSFLFDPITQLPCFIGSLKDEFGDKIQCYGSISRAWNEEILEQVSDLNLPRQVGTMLLKQCIEATHRGGSFLWYNQYNVHLGIQLLQKVIRAM